MGDIGTHAAIADKIIEKLKTGLPDDNYIFFELGNWLTDMSQLRDPPAHIGAKLTIWEAAQTGLAGLPGALELYARFNRYLDDLMGIPGRDGDLAKYFREFAFVLGCEKFRELGMDVEEFKDIYNQYWTQYYFHEHLDFPPWAIGEWPGDRSPSREEIHRCSDGAPAGGGTRKVLNYLEMQITYLGLLLTVIEDQWAIPRPSQPASNKERHKILARYGHASHAVEDFFFHSNFVEIAWAKLHDGELGDGSSIRERRVFYRRRRAPARYGETVPSDCIYTGYFGAEDIFHTLMDAAKGLRAETKSNLKFLGDMIDKMLNDDEEQQARHLKEHRDYLEHGYYDRAAEELQSRDKLHSESVKSIKRMSEIDYQLGLKYPRVCNDQNKSPLGIFGFVQLLAVMARKREEESDKAREALDKQEKIQDDRWKDGASIEEVGSHSLMSKDSERKQPLRQQAINLATCAALYIARRMIERVKLTELPAARFDKGAEVSSEYGASNTYDSRRIDWIHLLRHHLSHPDESEGPEPGHGWWEKALEDEGAETAHVLKFIDRAEVKRRVQQEREWRQHFEAQYNRFANLGQERWVKEYRPGSGVPF